ncbi:hypothetical protein YPPY53_2117, partial [Yersinia pestis PY-53]
MIPFHNILAGG